MIRTLLTAAALSVASTAGASATEGRLVAMNGGAHVFIWRDVAARDEGSRLIQAGVHRSNPAMIMRLISCDVRSGTRAIITSSGWVTHDVLVIEGPSSGCRGNVAAEEFQRAGSSAAPAPRTGIGPR